MRQRLWAGLGAAVALAASASAQVPFYSGSPGTYLTYCVSAATGEVLTENCLDGYNELVEVVKALIGNETDPYHFNGNNLAVLDGAFVPLCDVLCHGRGENLSFSSQLTPPPCTLPQGCARARRRRLRAFLRCRISRPRIWAASRLRLRARRPRVRRSWAPTRPLCSRTRFLSCVCRTKRARAAWCRSRRLWREQVRGVRPESVRKRGDCAP